MGEHTEPSIAKVACGGLAPRTCVYTTLVGHYEKLNEQLVAANSRLPFICLTDDPELQSETWQVRRVEPLFGLDPIRSQRALKLLPHEHLPDFDCSLYIDNSVILKTAPDALIEDHIGASGFCVPEHSSRNTVLDEFLQVEALGYDDPSRLFEQLNHYAMEFPDVLEEKPFWTGVLLRDHRNPKVRRMLSIWLAHVHRYSRRDQLSTNVALRLAGVTPAVLRINNHESFFHSWPKGTHTRRANYKRLSSPFLSNPAAKVREVERETNARLRKDRAQLKQKLRRERMKRQALLSSRTWRMTAQLRSILNVVRSNTSD